MAAALCSRMAAIAFRGGKLQNPICPHGDPLNPAIFSLDEAILQFGPAKRNGRRIVFTNGGHCVSRGQTAKSDLPAWRPFEPRNFQFRRSDFAVWPRETQWPPHCVHEWRPLRFAGPNCKIRSARMETL